MYRSTGPSIPDASSCEFVLSARNRPGIVPINMNDPSLKSTLPMCRCFRVFIREVPIITVNPVPTAKIGGTPNTSRPPVIRKPPPTPKKPLSVPTIRPRSSNSPGLTSTPALGKSMGGARGYWVELRSLPVDIALSATSQNRNNTRDVPAITATTKPAQRMGLSALKVWRKLEIEAYIAGSTLG